MSHPLHSKIDQIGYIVSDLDASIARWVRQAGVGPWTVFRNVTLPGRYQGRDITIGMNVGLAYRGGVQIELIQPATPGPSPYHAADGAPLLGPHHLAWIVDDCAAAVEALRARGLTPVFLGESPAVKVAYLSDPAEPQIRYELIQGAHMRPMLEAGIAAAARWDGSNPVIEAS